MRAQFLISPVVGCADQAVDAGDGGFDIGARNLLEQRIPPAHSRKRGVFVCHDKLAKITQHDSCGIEIAQRAQPGFAVCFFGKGEDIGCQQSLAKLRPYRPPTPAPTAAPNPTLALALHPVGPHPAGTVPLIIKPRIMTAKAQRRRAIKAHNRRLRTRAIPQPPAAGDEIESSQ